MSSALSVAASLSPTVRQEIGIQVLSRPQPVSHLAATHQVSRKFVYQQANIPPDTQKILDCLRQVASDTLERKRRLGHYAVVWRDGKPMAIGEDAPGDIAELPKSSIQNEDSGLE